MEKRWRKVSGVMCNNSRNERKHMVVRHTMLYVLETVALRKRQEAEL